jgi:hypothetical protein
MKMGVALQEARGWFSSSGWCKNNNIPFIMGKKQEQGKKNIGYGLTG